MTKFVFHTYSILFAVLFIVFFIILFAVAVFAFIQFSQGEQGSLVVVFSTIGVGLFSFLLLGDFATKITMAEELEEINKQFQRTLETKTVQASLDKIAKSLTSILVSIQTIETVRLNPPIQVRAVKPKENKE